MSMALISVLPVGTPFGTIEAKINFMLPVHKGELLAEGKIVHKGRSTAVLEATVFNIIERTTTRNCSRIGHFQYRSFKKPRTQITLRDSLDCNQTVC